VRTLLLLFLLPSCAFSKDFQIADVDELKAAVKVVQPGDSLILREGKWRDVRIILKGHGTAALPITLKAAVPGKTVVTGASTLGIFGEHLVVEGLLFKDPDPELSDLIQFRLDSDELAQNCRMTNCEISSQVQAEGTRESRWVNIYGSNNRLDHCTIQGKSGKGTTVVVWLGESGGGGHQIDHNYFGPRERLGKNGGETIRVGDSKTASLDGKCIVEQNLFERCNGETECISNKSCRNIYRENTFLEVSGTLTLRHGNACLVERNTFLGNNARGTGGIRIIGEDHVVRNNYLENLAGDDARAALCLMMGIPNSPAHRYVQVKRARIEDNSIVGCEHPVLIGLSDDKNASLPPVDSVFAKNRIVSPTHSIIEARCSIDGIRWEANQFLGKALGISVRTGIEMINLNIRPPSRISRASVGASW
jgi:poly(beta-D-mannuronate) lyase